ncbi:MAG: DegT/DnrJ/EryC1/StrS family aminotransferase [Nitrospinota bacterium]|nr:DegT/DnrJ/EryC1/StrS family aminotransferase [Nitrospinota bacterium]
MKIPITKPIFDESDFEAIAGPLKTGWLVQGPNVKRFEDLFAEFVGAKHAIATTSCTTSLHLSLLALGVGPGDEVIVPSFTFVATANAVEYTGATPVMCDVDTATFNIDIARLKDLAGRRMKHGKLKAIIPVHLFGLGADMDSINALAGGLGLKVIEDAACAFGSRGPGWSAGAAGAMGCFSFHPRKAITTGEGGMITTNNDELAEKARILRDHGASKSDFSRHTEKGGSLLPEYNLLGFNYRMTDIQGALGVSQMNKAQVILDGRAAGAKRYDDTLRVGWLKRPEAPAGYFHSYQSYVCLVDKERFGADVQAANIFRNRLMARLEEKGVTVRQGTHAVHTLGYYREKYGLKEEDFPSSLEADRLSLTLPLYAGIGAPEQDYVVETISALGRELGCAE